MTTAQPDKLVVTQEARRFAAEFFPEGLWQQAARDDVAQAFQRAMNQAAADEREANARLAEKMGRMASAGADRTTLARNIATAIRKRTT